MKRSVLMILCCLAGGSGLANMVHVYERTDAGGAIMQINERMIETGWNCTTVAAPTKSGCIFTHWTISTTQAFENHDEWGRALEAMEVETDGDGKLTVADQRELAKLKSAAGRRYTDLQLKAGDLNGNGKLDNADYQALREMLKKQ